MRLEHHRRSKRRAAWEKRPAGPRVEPVVKVKTAARGVWSLMYGMFKPVAPETHVPLNEVPRSARRA